MWYKRFSRAGPMRRLQSRTVKSRMALLSLVSIDGRLPVDQHGTEIPQATLADFLVVGVAMSLCWCSNTEEGKASLNVRLLLALDDFLFEDIPRYGGLLSIWASAGAVWFLWLDYLCCIQHRC